MQVVSPVWSLRRQCPVCEQGRCLVFVACPGCNRLAIVCAEDGAVFPNPRDLSQTPSTLGSGACSQCGRPDMHTFPAAHDALIRSAGFTKRDYE